MVNLCLMNPELATKFLDNKMWPAGQAGCEPRAALAQTIYSKLNVMLAMTRGRDENKERGMQELLEYALAEKHMELFAEFLQIDSDAGALTYDLHRRAQLAFGPRWDAFIEIQTTTCMGRNSLPRQIQIATQFHERTGRMGDLKAFLDSRIPQEAFERLDSRQLHHMQHIRSNVFKTCVLPRLRNFDATQWWLNLERNKDYKAHVSTILPLLVEHHIPYSGTSLTGGALTIDLLVRCASADLHYHSATIVKKLLDMGSPTDSLHAKKLQHYFIDLTRELARKLTAANIPLDLPPYSKIFQDALLEYILPPLGLRPSPPPPTHPSPLPHTCRECTLISTFLTSSQETARYTLRLPVIQHLIDVLTPSLKPETATFTITQTSQTSGTLSLQKPVCIYNTHLAAWHAERLRLLDFMALLPATCWGGYAPGILRALDEDGEGWVGEMTVDARRGGVRSVEVRGERKRKLVTTVTQGLKRPRSALDGRAGGEGAVHMMGGERLEVRE